jgi:hypothetical protein
MLPLNVLSLLPLTSSVGDPDPEQDPHVFGPPGSGFINPEYESGSGSFFFLLNVCSELKYCLQIKF